MLRVDSKQAILENATTARPQAGEQPSLTEAAARVAAAPPERTMSGAVVVGVAQIVEAVLLVALGYGIYSVYVAQPQAAFYVPLILASVLVSNILFNAARTHRIPMYRTVLQQIGRVLAAWSAVIVLVVSFAFVFKASELVSRGWLITWYASGAILLVAFRLLLRALINQWTAAGRLKRRTVIVGGGADAGTLIEAIRRDAENDVNLIGMFDDRVDERSPETVLDVPKLGKVSGLVDFARQTRVDLVIVSMPLSAEKRVLEMLKQLWVLPVDIRLSAHMSKLRFANRAYSYVGNVAVFDVADRPISDWNLIFKWLFDHLVAAVALTLLSPIMLATAIAIKLDSKGPVLFRQKRHGFNNELVEVFKFRSMYTNQADAAAVRLVTKDDQRVTRVGRFIRKTSLDELPQLFNVLQGKMSLVGPRPHAVAHNEMYRKLISGYMIRHKVRPGITGLAQVNGLRGETETLDKMSERVRYDLEYLRHWSPWLDIKIILKTIGQLLWGSKKAY